MKKHKNDMVIIPPPKWMGEPQKTAEIGYREKSEAMLKMWMDDDITDGEYNRIMDRLNKKTKRG